jgi:hypothetical protein
VDLWPTRARLCLQCRTALRAHEACDWVTHRVVDLDRLDGRRELVEWVWGPRRERWSSPDGLPDLWRALQLAVGRLRRRRLRRAPPKVLRRRRTPLGAVAQPPRFHSGAPIIGTIASGATALAPLTLRPVVGYGVVGRNQRAEPTDVVVRDAFCLEFTIQTDHGGHILVSAGRIDLVGAERGLEVEPGPALVAYAAGLDPLYDPADEDPVAFTSASETALELGDRVALRNEVRSRPDPRARGAGYRDAPDVILAPLGTPCLERLPPQPHEIAGPRGPCQPGSAVP